MIQFSLHARHSSCAIIPFHPLFHFVPKQNSANHDGNISLRSEEAQRKTHNSHVQKYDSVFFRFSSFLSIFVAMKIKFDWKRILVFTIISAGLLYITSSALMSAGILLLLFVVYYLLVGCIEAYQQKNREEKRKTHIRKRINKD